jgi:hypothetical protein
VKIYLASSWKNQEVLIGLAAVLRRHGHEVDCFCDASTGRYVFHWSEMLTSEDKSRSELDAITFLQDERSQRAFAEDKRWIDWAEAVVLVLPAGRSAHLEAGYAKGQGKRLVVLGQFPPGEFDVMYGFADALTRGPIDELLRLLE